jgi:hypothetical protein
MDSDLMINVSVNDSDVIIDSDVMTKYVIKQTPLVFTFESITDS